MVEIIRLGGIELEFLHSKDDTADSLDMFKMTVQPNAKVPVAHYHESWDEAVYGLSGVLNFDIGDEDVASGLGNPPSSGAASCMGSRTRRKRRRPASRC